MNNRLLFIILIYFSCKTKVSHDYRVGNDLFRDHINHYLYQDSLLIDSAKTFTNVYLITERTPYQYLNIDICIEGWSCEA
jgi:hypothetical protein